MSDETDPQAPAAADSAHDPDILDAAEGHRRFKAAFARDRAFYETLATAAQKPRLLWIGCSDSRVVPSQITSADPGELFEVRNIANVVPPYGHGETSVGAAIAYAVAVLGIDDIVVCGHTNCGGMKALATGPIDADAPADLAEWIRFTWPAHHLAELAGTPPHERHAATVRAHIHFQLDNLMTYPLVRARVAAGSLAIHGWLYEMDTGELLAYDREVGDWRPLTERVAPAPGDATPD